MRVPLRALVGITISLGWASASFAGFASTETYLPAVGRIPGQGGTQFYTTIWATNLTSAPVSFTFDFLKQGQANISPASFSDNLAPGQTKVYENVVESKLGLNNAIGAARVVSTGEVLLAERIYNQPPGADVGNTEGLFFAGVPKTFSISLGQSASIQGINQGGSENFRYNFALVETGGGSPTVNVQLFDGDGNMLGQKAYALLPYEQIQPGVTDITASVHTTNARITATVTGGSGSVLVAGAQLANESQDSSGFEMSFRDQLLGGSGTAGVTSLNGLTGALTIAHGANTTVNVNGSTITIDAVSGSGTGLTAVAHDNSLAGSGTVSVPLGVANGQVVRALTVGATTLHDSVTLAGGSNVTITPSGNTITIAATGGSSGGGLTSVATDTTLQGNGTGVSPLGVKLPASWSAGGSSVLSVTNTSGGTAPAILGTGNDGVGLVGVGTDTGTGVLGVAAGVGYESESFSFTGVAGVGTTGVYGATIGGSSGRLGTPSAGVEGDGMDGANGVLGTSGGGNSAGVEGRFSFSGGPTGALGGSSYGVFGDGGTVGDGVTGRASAGGHAGVHGQHTDTGGNFAGVEGEDKTTGFIGYLGGPDYGVFSHGDIKSDGGKSFVEPHPADPSKEINYMCLEGPESGTYFRGSSRLVDGFAIIAVPEDFRIVTSPKGMTVQLTPVGGLAVLAVMSQSLDRIVVQGSADVEFHYMINGVRRAFEKHEPIVPNSDFIPQSASDAAYWRSLPPESLRRMKANGTLNPDGSINLETAHRLGWDRRPGWDDPPAVAASQGTGR